MTALRTTIFLALFATAAPALAEHLTCASRRGEGPQACSTLVPGSDVRLLRQFGATRCIDGRTWSSRNDSIWVSDGCRAVFDVEAPDATASTAANAAPDGSARGTANHIIDPGDRAFDTRGLHRYAYSPTRENARRSCTDRAAVELRVGPQRVEAGDAQPLGHDQLAVHLATPRGRFECVVDRAGRVRSFAGLR